MLLVLISMLPGIPPVYIVNRWTKMAAKMRIHEFDSVLADTCGEITV